VNLLLIIYNRGEPMAYSGRFRPKNPDKYRGDHTKVVYRSSWECRLFSYLDKTSSILAWSSEEVVIPYWSKADHKTRRYFPDIWVRKVGPDGTIVEQIIEIKPEAECHPPKRPKKTRNARKAECRYKKAVKTYITNQCKWEAARKFVSDRNMTFRVLTEKHLGF